MNRATSYGTPPLVPPLVQASVSSSSSNTWRPSRVRTATTARSTTRRASHDDGARDPLDEALYDALAVADSIDDANRARDERPPPGSRAKAMRRWIVDRYGTGRSRALAAVVFVVGLTTVLLVYAYFSVFHQKRAADPRRCLLWVRLPERARPMPSSMGGGATDTDVLHADDTSLNDERRSCVGPDGRYCAATPWNGAHAAMYAAIGFAAPRLWWQAYLIGVAFEVIGWRSSECQHHVLDLVWNGVGLALGVGARALFDAARNKPVLGSNVKLAHRRHHADAAQHQQQQS